ncbi:hypothetical protein PLESTB_000026500 [Pleodorina starrii]|uniref:Protein kinase domain-containing protein n=1 Tax=Pleodorina starrii TaxID=330485 RepID=A0A9W6B9S6_9CHLO|nr:hypothetical protein PLESTM_001108100 [Pleodorina starrii]GLC47795.1 hypothetical protein PLESTB_000026500 [Pleodorina starrii]GLC70782.1 hypothetical protein PLESTF_001032700 [Pleodorina starrii]
MTSSVPRDLAAIAADGTSRDQAIQERIQAAASLNAMLYAQIENDFATVDRTEQERDAWAAHARGLAQKLVQARKRIVRLERALAEATGQPQPATSSLLTSDTSTDDADEDARQLAELLDLQLSAGGPDLQAAAAPQQHRSPAPASLAQQRARTAALYPASVLSATAETRTAMAAEAAAAAAGQGPLSTDAVDGGALAGPGPGSLPINPTPNQQRVLEALVRRGQAMGWLIQLSEVTLGSVLGEGEFGITYLGTWRHAAVAVKVVRLRHAAELTSFLREVETMSYIRHPNVVPFLGACLTAPDKLSLVSEYMTGGTLCEWLHPGGLPAPGTQSGNLLNPAKPLLERLKMAHQVALGMCALESCRPAVLHRDLKPANVYLDQRGVARVGDFGLSRRLLEEARASLTGETGTYFYMAPEVMRHEVYDTKADVWSWGVLLSECITCAMPYGHTYMTPVQVAQAVSAEELAPVVPGNIHEEVQLVLRLACQFDPEMRPDFASLADMLGGAIKHMEALEAVKPTLLASIQSGLLGAWSGAWGRGTSYPRTGQQRKLMKQASNPV